MKTDDFDYDLPEELIAQTPLKDRSSSRLMVMDKKTGEIEHKHFYDVLNYLNPGDTLVILWDFDKFNPNDLDQFHKIVSKAFPDNQVLFIPKGTEIGVIKNEIITAF